MEEERLEFYESVRIQSNPELPEELKRTIESAVQSLGSAVFFGPIPLQRLQASTAIVFIEKNDEDLATFTVDAPTVRRFNASMKIRGPYDLGLVDALVRAVRRLPRRDSGLAQNMEVDRSSQSIPTSLGFSVYIDPGNAPDEVIADFLEALSDLHVAHGGDGLTFTSTGAGFVAAEVDSDA